MQVGRKIRVLSEETGEGGVVERIQIARVYGPDTGGARLMV